jgi:two-component system, response regulator PdtaR
MKAAKNIFIVEDDGILVLVNAKLVSDAGYNVIGHSNNGLEAVELIKKLKPDIILMDIKLKGEMDGIDAVKEIQKFVNIPVIYLTGNSEAEIYKRAQETNFLSFLIKPVNGDMLKQAFDDLCI